MFLPDQTRQHAVFERLRQGILTGTLPTGARLPPTRALATELGVARQTVVLAYERLSAEGYVRAHAPFIADPDGDRIEAYCGAAS